MTRSRLRELGLIKRREKVLGIRESSWFMAGMYYVCDVTVAGEEVEKRFVLKCPWDFTATLLEDPRRIDNGREVISSFVRRYVWTMKMLASLGLQGVRVPRAEAYDEGTIVQENPGGRAPREEDFNSLANISKMMEEKTGMKCIERFYAGLKGFEEDSGFLMTDDSILITDVSGFMPLSPL